MGVSAGCGGRVGLPPLGGVGYNGRMAEAASRRWFLLTPGRLLAVLLAVEGFLWLSERFQWMSKGWPVVVAVAAVATFFLLMLLWFLAALAFKWRFQFSILSLLVLVVAVALPFAWLATEMKAARKQKAVVEWIQKAGRRAAYDYELDQEGSSIPGPGAKPPGPAWLRKLLGDDLFANVTAVYFVSPRVDDAGLEGLTRLAQLQWLDLSGTEISDSELQHLKGLSRLRGICLDNTTISDGGLEHLKGLTQLQTLWLNDTTISDSGLEHLKGLTQLCTLWLGGTKVSDAGVKKLQRALPNCEINR